MEEKIQVDKLLLPFLFNPSVGNGSYLASGLLLTGSELYRANLVTQKRDNCMTDEKYLKVSPLINSELM